MRTSLLILALGFCLSTFAQDSCGEALNITAGTYTIDQIDGESPAFVCASGGANQSAAEWYRYTAADQITLTISSSLPQNSTDTRVNVYTDNCFSYICLDGDDDSGENLLSTVSVNLDEGESVLIVWDNNWNSEGFDFILTEQEYVPGVFEFTEEFIGGSGSALGVVDMNGDFLDDIVKVTALNINIQFQQEDGTFIEQNFPTTEADNTPSWSLAAGDIDANGYTDLLYGGGSGVTFMMANDDGTAFEEVSFDEYVFSQRSNMIDLNGDGHLDAFVCHDVQPNVYFLNDGEGNLTFFQGGIGDVEGGGNYGSIWVDYDDDQDPDLFIAKCRGGDSPANINELHRNNGDGTFTNVAPALGLDDNIQTWSSAWGDYDNDGDMDVMIGASSDANGLHKLLRNDNDGIFTDITAGSGFDVFTSTSIEHVAYDFDNDGHVDIMTSGDVIMHNNGDWTFSPMSTEVNNNAVGDLNNDGFLDVLSGSNVYFNEGNDNNWIKFNLIGTQSTLNAIGARVIVETNMGRHTREVRSGEGFRYMSSLNVHIGIGQEEEISNVTIKWPSGIIETYDNVAINQTFTAVEGQTVSVIEEEVLEIALFPNPVSERMQVRLPNDLRPTRLDIFDNAGRLVRSEAWSNNIIEVSELPTGIYILELEVQGERLRQSFSKL